MATVRGTVEIDIETCKGCELCIDACPQGSLALSREINKRSYHYAVLVQDNCTGCVNCALVCPDAVITVYRTRKSPVAAKGAAAPVAAAAASREPVAVISRVKGNIAVSVDDDEIPAEGRVSI